MNNNNSSNSNSSDLIMANNCEEQLLKLGRYLDSVKSLINVCMVDFIINDVYSNILTSEIQSDLSSLSSTQLELLPSYTQEIIDNTFKKECLPLNLYTFLQNLGNYHLSNLNVLSNLNDIKIQDGNQSTYLQHFDSIMSDKKMHEVVVMSDFVQKISSDAKINTIVDLGSGKGYLSQFLSSIFNFKVLAIDASNVNTKSAQKREKNLEKQWDALIRRAEYRFNHGEEPQPRGKNWKAKEIKNDGNHSSPSSTTTEFLSGKKLVNLTQFIDEETDVIHLIQSTFNDEDIKKFGLIGLHTCGNLAANSIRLFLNNPDCQMICNVGCCYHHIDEEFYTNPYNEDSETSFPSFPLSKALKNQKYYLGRNARMMAAQPMDRAINKKTLPNQSILWRAILQDVLINHYPELNMKNRKVGKIASKSDSYMEYIKFALQKLKIDQKLTDEELQNHYHKCKDEFEHKINAFYQLRSLFAPLIEGLILLDRLVYIQEEMIENNSSNSIEEVHLVQLFDSVISPRSYAIVAVKKK